MPKMRMRRKMEKRRTPRTTQSESTTEPSAEGERTTEVSDDANERWRPKPR
jgi:hypothetical protein